MRDIPALIARLEKATGADRELDFWLSIRLPIGRYTQHTDAELQADIDLVGIEGMVIDAPYTASIDAAVDLVERVLPGMSTYLLRKVLERVSHIPIPYKVQTDTPQSWMARELCAALLRAIEAQGGET